MLPTLSKTAAERIFTLLIDWENVSVPHAVNAEDSFDGVGVDAGEAGLYRGFMFYRKNIVIPQTDEGKKFILEFEAVRQSVYLYVNGNMAGYYEAGITAMGFDITPYVAAGEENIIAVATDNNSDRGQDNKFIAADGKEKVKVTMETIPGHEPGDASGIGYQWNTKDFNEVQGGISGNVNLYAKNKVYQTLPLYNNLKTPVIIFMPIILISAEAARILPLRRKSETKQTQIRKSRFA